MATSIPIAGRQRSANEREHFGSNSSASSSSCRPTSFPPPSAPPAAPTTHPSAVRSVPTHRHSQQYQLPNTMPHVRSNTQTLGQVLSASGARLQATSSDRDKVRTTTRVLNLASQYLQVKMNTFSSFDLSSSLSMLDPGGSKNPSTSLSASSSSGNGATYGTIRPVPRQYLNYHVRQRENGAWQATVSLVQPFVRGLFTDPQGMRPAYITMGFYGTEEGALAACRNHAPPVWAEPVKGCVCYMCLDGKNLYKSPLHCRNCGQLVCRKCSKSRWPQGMLPSTYHNNERTVRICDACNHLAWNFRRALKDGDWTRVLELCASGNVNIWTPFLVESVREYPVHCAAEGGNLEVLRWLIDELGCPLYETTDGAAPLVTQKGDSVLGVAARYQRTAIMRWLVTVKGCKTSEIVCRQLLWGTIDFLLREECGGEGGGERGRCSARWMSSPRVSSHSYRSRQQIIGEEEKKEEDRF
ncbi:hypothetical protein VYU27_000703 [Nannochloropsis oceanica]